MDENTAGRQWTVGQFENPFVDEQKRQNAALAQHMLGQVADSWYDPNNPKGIPHPWPSGTASTSNVLKATQGIKHDSHKPRMDLLDSDALEGLAKVLTFGAGKYAPSNWRGGILYSRLIAAAMRHLTAYNRGEDLDPESGLSHIDHAACCLMFLSNFLKNRPDLDDRYKAPNGAEGTK